MEQVKLIDFISSNSFVREIVLEIVAKFVVQNNWNYVLFQVETHHLAVIRDFFFWKVKDFQRFYNFYIQTFVNKQNKSLTNRNIPCLYFVNKT